jgi:hypothetical protein
MKRLLWISLICLLTTLAGAPVCFGDCNPDPFIPDLRPPCPDILDGLAKAAKAPKRPVADLNTNTDGTRRNFWRLYPHKPGYEAAELAFYEALQGKDKYYLMLALQGGMNDRVTRWPNILGVLNGTVAPEDLDKFPKTMDGGIPPYAFPLFANWVNALRRSEGREEEGAIATPFILATAVQDRSNWRKAYEESRDWAELISGGLDISEYVEPEVYLRQQMEMGVSLVLARSRPADLPDPWIATKDLYDLFLEMFNKEDKEAVHAAAKTVLHKPKNSVGGLAERADVAIGTYSQRPSPNPFLLFLTLVTNKSKSPRNYAIALCLDQYAMLGGEATATFNSRDQWAKAFLVYNQIVTKYGEENVHSAALRLKDAEKTSEGGLRADPQSKSMIFWFQTLIKDPKAVIPDAQVAHFKASSYDPHWMGKIVEVRGTVSRVDLAKGSPPYATIHFKESRDDAIVGYTPNSDMLQEIYGANFSNLVGRPVEIWGQVGAWGEGAGVRIISRDQVNVLDAANALGANFTESRPEWLTAAKPVENLVESAKYLAWKKFPPGTTVTYENRLLHENTPESNQYTRSKISLITFRLESVDDKRAVVLSDSTVWHMNGQVSHSPQTKFVYPANEAPGQSPAPSPNESGDETLEISGKKFTTHWQSVWQNHTTVDITPDPQTFTKTWTSEEVPGGLVLTHHQDHTEIVGKEYRNIDETILVPVQNVEPELGSSSSTKQTSGAPAAQPATPSRNIPTAESMNRPEAKAAPTTPAAPASVQTAPPTSRRRPDSPVTPTPALSSQAEFAKHYNLVMTRAVRAEAGLAQLQRKQAAPRAELPESVRTARDRLDAQLRTVASAMRARDNGAAEQSLPAVEDTLTVIEQFLAKVAHQP